MMNSTKRKRTQAAAAGAVLLAVMLTVSACGDSKETSPNNNGQNAVTETPITDQLPEQSGIQDPGTASPDSNNNSNNSSNNSTAGKGVNSEEPADETVIHAEGVFNGGIDSNSIEIETNNGPEAFRVNAELAPTVAALPDYANVRIEYTELIIDSDTKQLWLTKIEQIE